MICKFKSFVFGIFIILLNNYECYSDYKDERESLYVIREKIEIGDYESSELLIQNQLNEIKQYPTSRYKDSLQLTIQLFQARLNERKEELAVALRICTESLIEIKNQKFYQLEIETLLLIALIYEKSENLELTFEYLQKAYNTIQDNDKPNYLSTYYIRSSSYLRLKNKHNEALDAAFNAKMYSTIYDIESDLIDSYLLLGILLPPSKVDEAIKYYKILVEYHKNRGNNSVVAIMYNNISKRHLNVENLDSALIYANIAIGYLTDSPSHHVAAIIFHNQSKVLEALGKFDEALSAYKLFHVNKLSEEDLKEKIEINKLAETYKAHKKEEAIKNKNAKLIFLTILVALIGIGWVFLWKKNIKIKKQNFTINNHLDQLKRLLDQKEVLLSELQHRVKNNLQQVVSLLEIQKESAQNKDFNEIINESQNRIISMAMLHNKISLIDTFDSIRFNEYLNDLGVLVDNSYSNPDRKIHLHINSSVNQLSIDSAISLGLIVVELMSNSYKHAFNGVENGNIKISLYWDTLLCKHLLEYSDDGSGWKWENESSGMGVEIINGLVHQLNGSITDSDMGNFGIRINF